ncbi:AAA domain-containing protein, partial [Streptomyces sp. NPDC050698]
DLAVAAFSHEIEDQIRNLGAEHLFEIWRNMLEVKYEYDLQQQDAIEYIARDIDGNRIYFKCDSNLSADDQGQSRTMRLHDGSLLTGEIIEVDVSTNELTFVSYNASPEESNVPARGVISIDIGSNKVSLDRQRTALEAIRSGSKESVRSDLGELIRHPANVDKVARSGDVVLFQDLDEDKVEAVQKAEALKDLLLIEGPPGTGKTTLIAEIVLQQLSKNRGARILLTSQTNIALDNAIERIERVSTERDLGLSITRLGRIDDVRIGVEVRKHLLPIRMDAWKEEALQRSESFLEQWCEARGVDRRQVEVGVLVEQALQLKTKLREIDEEERILQQFAAKYPLQEPTTEAFNDDPPVDLDLDTGVGQAQQDLAQLRDYRISLRRQLEVVRIDLRKFGTFEADLADEDELSLREFLDL